MKLSENIKPISYLKAHASQIIREVSSTRSPYIITHNGEAKAILQDLESYEEMQESLAMLKIIANGTREKESGKFSTAKAAFATLRNRVKNA